MIHIDSTITIHIGDILLYGGCPVINETEIMTVPIQQVDGSYVWDTGDGLFHLFIYEQETKLVITYHLEWHRTDVLNSFGLRFAGIKNLRAYLKNGYHSWDAAFYVEPEGITDFTQQEERPEVGYAMTQLLARHGNQHLLIGFDRHDRFQQTFTFETQKTPTSLTILTLWDRRELRSGDKCESESLHFLPHTAVEDGLKAWAQLVADASEQPPRLDKPPITGWCSWYDQYSFITEKSVLEYLSGIHETVQRENLPMRVFQLDDGFTPEMGDWLDVKPQFPRGMKPLLDDIREAGFVPGLWIAPLMVGNRSRLFAEHPDWVVKDAKTGKPFVKNRLYSEWRWHKRSEEYYILDITHPDAYAYIQRVFKIWREDWGCEYFKIDFFYWGAEYGPDIVQWYTSGLTRIEVWRRFAELIRDSIGEDAWWLACGTPLWASIGLVDAIRISNDVGVEWTGDLSAEALLRDQSTRNFANHILWQIDPDCVLLRERFHFLDDTEITSLALYAGMSGGVMLTSDALHELSEKRLDLWRFVLGDGMTRNSCQYPLLGTTSIFYERMIQGHTIKHVTRSSDPVILQLRRGSQIAVLHIFNTGNQAVERTYILSELDLGSLSYAYNWGDDHNLGCLDDGYLSVNLQAHGSALIFLSDEALSERPASLSVQ